MTDEIGDDVKKKRARTFFRIRVGVLLAILACVLLYAYRDVQSRRARRDWDHTLDVAIVLLRRDRIDDAATTALRDRVPALQERLEAEMHRYRRGFRPFTFHFFGPLDVSRDAPRAESDALLDLAKHTWALRTYLRAIDDALGIDTGAFDGRIYVTAHKPANDERTRVEGSSEQGGRIGNVDVELNADMADFALIVVAHELFHTLGATDKYDDQGRTRIPDGLAEPGRRPLYPQRMVEVMARNRPDAPGIEKTPDGIDELGVGPATAREIGWSR